MAKTRALLTDDEVRQLEKLAAVLTVEQLGDYFGISGRHLRRRFADDPVLMSAYKRGKSRAVSGVATKLLAMCHEGNVTAMIFYLKTQAGWRETDPKFVPVPKIAELSERDLEREQRRLGIVK